MYQRTSKNSKTVFVGLIATDFHPFHLEAFSHVAQIVMVKTAFRETSACKRPLVTAMRIVHGCLYVPM